MMQHHVPVTDASTHTMAEPYSTCIVDRDTSQLVIPFVDPEFQPADRVKIALEEVQDTGGSDIYRAMEERRNRRPWWRKLLDALPTIKWGDEEFPESDYDRG